jgi:hypothetical protein
MVRCALDFNPPASALLYNMTIRGAQASHAECDAESGRARSTDS